MDFLRQRFEWDGSSQRALDRSWSTNPLIGFKAAIFSDTFKINQLMPPVSNAQGSEYSALIRTFNSAETLPRTLVSLDNQVKPPRRYIFVDSGSTDLTLACLPPNSQVHKFVGNKFSYSEALNQGLNFISTDYVLIISSHTELVNPRAMTYAIDLLAANSGIGAAYFCTENDGPLRHELVDQTNFTGFNGLWNTCAVIKMPLLLKRKFRPDVFTAEDQEWAAWLFSEERQSIARISGEAMAIHNPRRNSLNKRLNEYIAVAYFSNQKLLKWSNIAMLARKAVSPKSRLPLIERKFRLLLSFYLAACHFRQPRRNSRYF